MKYAIECLSVAVFILVVCAFTFFKVKPIIEQKDGASKKKWLLFFRIIIVAGCINSLYLITLGIYFFLKYS